MFMKHIYIIFFYFINVAKTFNLLETEDFKIDFSYETAFLLNSYVDKLLRYARIIGLPDSGSLSLKISLGALYIF